MLDADIGGRLVAGAVILIVLATVLIAAVIIAG